MKKSIIISAIAALLFFTETAYALNPYENMNCCTWSLMIPVLFFSEIYYGIKDSQTVTASVNGEKGKFQRKSAVFNENKEGFIISGVLLEKVKTEIRGQSITILPGEMKFHENGNIAMCHISESMLYTGDSTLVPCRDIVEFYDDGALKKTNLTKSRSGIFSDDFFEYSEISADNKAILFPFQGHERKIFGSVTFYRDGRIRECMTAADDKFIIAGYKINAAGGTMLGLSENGRIISMKPPFEKTASIKYKNNFISLSGLILLHENGRLKSCTLKDPLMIQNGRNSFTAKGPAEFYRNEMVKTCKITIPLKLKVNANTIEFAADNPDSSYNLGLSFYDNGNIRSGKISDGRKQYYIHDRYRFRLKEGWRIELYRNGSIKKLCPADEPVIQAGEIRLVLDENYIQFYRNGKILSANIKSSSDFLYHGKTVRMNAYSGELFFNEKQEVIAFTNSRPEEFSISGNPVTIPPLHAISYSDYDNKIISYVQIDAEDITLPQNIILENYDEIRWMDIFVKAGLFYNDKKKERIKADKVSEIMFSDDAFILIDGKKHLCRAMEWVKLPVK